MAWDDDVELDLRELDDFVNELQSLEKYFPRQARRLIMRIGSKARTIVLKKAKSLVKKKKGNYYKSIKRGKPWKDDGTNEHKIRVYTRANHAHLIEKGHRIVGKDGSEHGFKEGYHVFDEGEKEIERQWDKMARDEFDKILDKI